MRDLTLTLWKRKHELKVKHLEGIKPMLPKQEYEALVQSLQDELQTFFKAHEEEKKKNG